MAIGQSLKRLEDERFLTGLGRYVDDLAQPGAAHAVFVRSTHAHARVRSIETAAARHAAGVLLVVTGRDWEAAELGTSPCLWVVHSRGGQAMQEVRRPIFATDVVHHVGDTLAMVVAETLAAAQEAAEQIEIDYEPLPAVADATEALRADAPRVHESLTGNLAYDWEQGDEAATLRAFERARHVSEIVLINNRLAPCPMEPRAVIGHWERATDHYTLWTTTQNPHLVRQWLCNDSLFLPEHQLRVVAPDVGGGFGQKIYHYPEEAAVLWASRRIGRPVRWVSTRAENFVVDTQARDHRTAARMAFSEDGRILALFVETVANLGAYMSPFAACIPTYFYAPMLSGMYDIPQIYCRVKAAYTNTVPVDAYRGAGRPECVYVLERLLENGARELGVDVCAMRRRNFIAPSAFPHQVATGMLYDSGDYPGLMDLVQARIDFAALREQQARLRQAGVLMGIGLAGFVECAGAGPSKLGAKAGSKIGLWDVASLRVHPSGKVTVFCGSHSHGQGHATTFAQVVAARLGCPVADVSIVEGDTDRIPFGQGTWASRSMSVVGGAIALGLDKLVDKGARLAAHLLECAETDVSFAEGAYRVTGTDRAIAFRDIAAAAYHGASYPADFQLGLEETMFFDPDNYNFPSALHVCVLLIDPETGVVVIRDYLTVDDVGRVINPMIVEGQIHGGLAQGIGQALLENVVYEPKSAQLLTGSFMDYAMPRAADLPSFTTEMQETPSPNNPLGVKGAGESGTIGAPAAVVNAAVDSLWHLGVRHLDMPLTPERVWNTIVRAKRQGMEQSRVPVPVEA